MVKTMKPGASLNVTSDQVTDLVFQLEPEARRDLLRKLWAERKEFWAEIRSKGEGRMRSLATERGRDWDTMSEEEREEFVDDLLHEV
jgi:hypothetical protein